jgi:peptidoglycan hydrolase CwlO-like protein
MKYFNVIVTIILFISLIFNFTLTSKLRQVENQLMNVSNNQQEIMSSINGQEQHIRSVMDDIQKQQSWISDITMNVNTKNSPKDETMAQFNWQIKEQSRDSKVMFQYSWFRQELEAWGRFFAS